MFNALALHILQDRLHHLVVLDEAAQASLRVELGRGEATLQNLRVRPEAAGVLLDKLGVAAPKVFVQHGTVKELGVRLGSKQVVLRGVSVTLGIDGTEVGVEVAATEVEVSAKHVAVEALCVWHLAPDITTWEPVVEPWDCVITWEPVSNPDTPTPPTPHPPPTPVSATATWLTDALASLSQLCVAVSSTATLRVNVTPALFETLGAFLAALHAEGGVEDPEAAPCRHIFVNDLGVEVEVWFPRDAGGGAGDGERPRLSVPNGGVLPLVHPSSLQAAGRRGDDGTLDAGLAVHLGVPGFLPVVNLSVDTVGKRAVRLRPKHRRTPTGRIAPAQTVQWSVEAAPGRKTITLRSLVAVSNSTPCHVAVRGTELLGFDGTPTPPPSSSPGDVELSAVGQGTRFGACVETVLAPGEVWHLPMDVAASCAVTLRPTVPSGGGHAPDPAYGWASFYLHNADAPVYHARGLALPSVNFATQPVWVGGCNANRAPPAAADDDSAPGSPTPEDLSAALLAEVAALAATGSPPAPPTVGPLAAFTPESPSVAAVLTHTKFFHVHGEVGGGAATPLTLSLHAPLAVENALCAPLRFQLGFPITASKWWSRATPRFLVALNASLDAGQTAPVLFNATNPTLNQAIDAVSGGAQSAAVPHIRWAPAGYRWSPWAAVPRPGPSPSDAQPHMEALKCEAISGDGVTLTVEHGVSPAAVQVTLFAAAWIVNGTSLPLGLSIAEGAVVAPRGVALLGGPPAKRSKAKVKVRVGSSPWSDNMPAMVAGTTGVLPVTAAKPAAKDAPRRQWELAVCSWPQVDVMGGAFRRTMMVLLSPRLVVLNQVDMDLEVTQVGLEDHATTLAHGHHSGFHWTDAAAAKLVAFRVAGYHWSGGLDVLNAGEAAVMLRSASRGSPPLILRVNVVPHPLHGTALISVGWEGTAARYPVYRIDNHASVPIAYQQTGVASGVHTHLVVAPGSSALFGWDRPSGEKPPTLNVCAAASAVGSPTAVGMAATPKGTTVAAAAVPFHDLTFGATLTGGVRLEVTLDGPTRVLALTDSTTRAPESPLYGYLPPVPRAIMQSSVDLLLGVHVASLVVSVVDTSRQELLAVWVDGLSVSRAGTVQSFSVDVVMEEVRVDNQTPVGPSEVVVCRKAVGDTAAGGGGGGEEEGGPSSPHLPFLQVALNVHHHQSCRNLWHIGSASVLLQEMDVSVDEELLRRAYLTAAAAGKAVGAPVAAPRLDTGDDLDAALDRVGRWWQAGHLGDVASYGSLSRHRFFFSSLIVNATEVSLTFFRSPSCVNTALRVSSPVTVTLNALGLFAANVRQAPLRLRGVELHNVLSSGRQLAASLASHYKAQVLRQLYRLLLSSELLGNPVGTFSTLGTGFKDFFRSPRTGTVSLLANTVRGVGVAASSITGSLGHGLAFLSADPEFVRVRQARALSMRGASAKSAVSLSAKQLWAGLKQGAAGVLTQPYKGAKTHGLVGLLSGTAKGVVGVMVKPLSGVVDLATTGLRRVSAPRDGDGAARRRPARLTWGAARAIHVEPSRLDAVHDGLRLAGVVVDHFTMSGQRAVVEEHFHHVDLQPAPLVLVFTTSRVLGVAVGDDGAVSLAWEVAATDPTARYQAFRRRLVELCRVVVGEAAFDGTTLGGLLQAAEDVVAAAVARGAAVPAEDHPALFGVPPEVAAVRGAGDAGDGEVKEGDAAQASPLPFLQPAIALASTMNPAAPPGDNFTALAASIASITREYMAHAEAAVAPRRPKPLDADSLWPVVTYTLFKAASTAGVLTSLLVETLGVGDDGDGGDEYTACMYSGALQYMANHL